MKKIIYLLVFVLLVALTGCETEPKATDDFSIHLEKDNVTLKMTETHEILYTVKNNGVDTVKDVTLTLTNNDNNVISLEGNTVTALKEGFAAVKISLNDDPTIEAFVDFTVTKSLSAFVSKTSIFAREELAITYVDVADKTNLGVNFESSNTAVATVNNQGIIKGVTPGEATITVTSKTNSASVTLVITVSEVEIDNITISDLPSKISILDEFSLFAEVSPTLAFQEVIWESSDSSIASVDEFGYVIILKVGEVTITATSKVDNTKKATVTFSSEVDPMDLMTKLHIENPIRQYVTTYGYNPDERYQWVNGSVSLYFNADLNLEVKYVPVDENKYTGTIASKEMIVEAENLLKVRPGILHPETKYIIYHDTGNHNPGADANMHHIYMQSADNRNNRARSWHYTVDDTKVIQHIPDNEVAWQGDHFDAYAYGIGVETAVNFGSDLYTTWHRTAKLMAGFMEKYNIGLDGIKQHHDFDIALATGGFWNKDCPRTLRHANLYDLAINMVYAEYLVKTLLADYEVTFKSLNPSIVDDRGRVIAAPEVATRVGYIVNIKGEDYNESKVLYSVIPGVDGSTTVELGGTEADLLASTAFDQLVASLPDELTSSDEIYVEEARNAYDALTETQKELTTTYNLLQEKELELHSLAKVNTQVVISEVMLSNNTHTKYGYIELYNPGYREISLNGWTLQYASGNNPFNVDLSNFNKTWIKFNETDVIKAKGHYLVMVSEGTTNGSLLLPLADYVSRISLGSSGVIALVNNDVQVTSASQSNIVDLLGYGDVTLSEGTSYKGTLTNAVSRWGFIDTNNNDLDFRSEEYSPQNSDRKVLIEELTTESYNALLVDTLINSLPRTLVLNDESLVTEARNAYDALTVAEKAMVSLYEKLLDKEMEIAGLKDPNVLVIYEAIRNIPRKINNDYTFPTSEGLTIAYKAGQDTSYFNLATGKYLKAAYSYLPLTLVATKDTAAVEFQVNFGILDKDQVGVFTTGAAVPAAGGKTSEGKGTPAEQLNKVGFGGVAITVDNKVYFVGKGSFITLNKPLSGNTLTIEDLRPYGSNADATAVYNQSIIKGVPTGYAGDGVLYYNASDIALKLNPSDTYGRNNSSTYGYGKIVFSPNDDGTYTAKTKWADSGNNTTRGNNVETLLPGEFVYCPHTYSTNPNGGTWLMQEGSGGAIGVLAPGVKLSISYFKTFE